MKEITITEKNSQYKKNRYFLSESTIINIESTLENWLFLTFNSKFLPEGDTPTAKRITTLITDENVPRFIININSNTKVNIFINYECEGYFCEIINIKNKSEVKHRVISTISNDMYGFLQCNIGKNSKIFSKALTISAANNRKISQIEVNHNNDNAVGEICCWQILKGGFVEVNCVSNILKTSNNCVAQQKLKSILFNKKATALNRPILNIFNRNVVATHASAIGCINPAEIYYLNTRGFSLKVAQFLILKGYITALFVGIDEHVRNLFINKVILILNFSVDKSYITENHM